MSFRTLATLALTASPIVLVDAFAIQVNDRQTTEKSPVDSTQLQNDITLSTLLTHAQTLQDFAYSYPERNRYFGGLAYNDSVQYIYDTLTSGQAEGYYDIQLQSFVEPEYVPGNWSLQEDGEDVDGAALMTFSPNGRADAALVVVGDVGCESSNFPASVSGQIALISRGTCSFGLKVANAGTAGAIGAIIYNTEDGIFPPAASLNPEGRPEGPYVPTLTVTQAQALDWIEQIDAGNTITVDMLVEGSAQVPIYSQNVIAQTKGGDQNEVIQLGAHLDSVKEGPGINDDGSGTIALLEIAKQLAKYTTTNAVRFSWWSNEEGGLLGSTYYVSQLSEEEIAKIRLYLNFDMIASPNYVFSVYDGDGSAYNISGPSGSAEAEKLFQDYYTSAGQNWTSSEFTGRSDYGPFLDVGIACGGLDTGAELIKTEEEAARFGGQAGIAYDVNYHGPGDTVDNLAHVALEVNSKAIAHAVATYGTSFETLPSKSAALVKLASTSSSTHQFIWKGNTVMV